MTNQERDDLIQRWEGRADEFFTFCSDHPQNQKDNMRYHDIAAIYKICAKELRDTIKCE